MKEKVSVYYNQITIRLQSDHNWITISDVIVYILEAHSTSSSLTKKKDKGERENERKEKERKEVEKRRREKGMERVCAERKRKGRKRCGRKDEEEGEGEGK